MKQQKNYSSKKCAICKCDIPKERTMCDQCIKDHAQKVIDIIDSDIPKEKRRRV